MKRKPFIFIILIVVLITIMIAIVSCIDDPVVPDGPMIKQEFNISDFSTLEKVFPKTLLLPYKYGNEIIFVNNPEYPLAGVEILEKISLIEKIDSLKSGRWEERYSGYTIKVYFRIEENWSSDESFLENYIEENFNGYNIYINNNSNEIFLNDNKNSMVYSINIDAIKEMTKDQKIGIIREYIGIMLEAK